MAKKSLTELLQEEAEKSAQPQVEILQETSDDEVLDEKVVMNKPASSSTKRSNPTKADLEATIKELRKAFPALCRHRTISSATIIDCRWAP